ncbi:MAG: UDP-4-amino-4,6-dideoxy-N-acetyl-beta-L-altrosamine transaminase [Alphaproteobacteria bacterium RIFOXYD12_FULL_60_8]|nr:MAG: UDP-4-amino-4,6-dideoxy-N-acetyl-beta-L-altrosamine transaminase [Alphaproteobacteria bacterium RIFOXYD12_FULL_60_8]
MHTLPYGRQWIDESDIEAVTSVLRSDFLTQGPMVERFERALCEAVGAHHAVAVSNGTAALHLAAMALDLGPGKMLWTSPNTFVASSNCALYCGADVDFVDIELETGNMDMAALSKKLATAKRKPDVVVPVHFAGQSCDMAALGILKEKYGFKVIEDACHAIGGWDAQGRKVGGCAVADLAAFSFHPVKVVTTGEGGAVTTNDKTLADRIALLRTHGITRDPIFMDSKADGPWDYHQIELGLNYRLTDIQAALGFSQLSRLEDFVTRRNELAHRYDDALIGFPLIPLKVRKGVRSAYHLYVVHLNDPSHRRLAFEALRKEGIHVQVHYIPVPSQPYYRHLGFRAEDFPMALSHYAGALTLPLYPAMSNDDQDRVVETLGRVLGAIA